MLIHADKIRAYLVKHHMPERSLVLGDEIQLNIEALDVLREQAKIEGFNERKRIDLSRDAMWKDLINEIDTPSLFATKRLIELHVEDKKLSKTAADTLRAISELKHFDNVRLVIYAPNFEKAQSFPWFKAIEKSGFVIVRSYVLSAVQFDVQIKQRLLAAEVQLDEQAYQLFCDYMLGNLSAAQQSIQRLGLSGYSQLNAQKLRSILSDVSRFNMADFKYAILHQNWLNAYQIATKMEGEDRHSLLQLNWQLERDFSILLQMTQQPASQWMGIFNHYRLYAQQQKLYQAAANHFRASQILQMLKLSAKLDAVQKGAEFGDAWLTLKQFLLLKSKPILAKK